MGPIYLPAQNWYSIRLRDTSPKKTNKLPPENQWLEDGRCNFPIELVPF